MSRSWLTETIDRPTPVRCRTRLPCSRPGERTRPRRRRDGTGHVLVADKVGDGKAFQTQSVVGLDEPAGDLMQETSANPADAGMLSGQPADCLYMVAGTGLGTRCRSGPPP